ncbi:fatty-acid amide hydrolase 2 [Hetaerina americana]|uniref:fatty-acid amide hydrolase 2 n=1 Tax=Hetaerina americana TaxID=62018 RepID=UPI003A7F2E88
MPSKRAFQSHARRILRRLVDITMGFLFRLVYRNPGARVNPIEDLLLLDTASTLALKIRTKKVKSVEVVEKYIARIKDINTLLNCVVDERFEEALAEARAVDKLIESGTTSEEEMAKETPYLGVPFTTKDSIQVKGLKFTAGLYARRNIKGAEDAAAVTTLRRAGAIPLALTNVSELCMWWESHNTVHGRTNNPYDSNRIVGGSSGGEGCLQAAAGSPMGIGSDIGGSIRMPCFFNGIFGHKPSRGLVSNAGEYPIASKDHDLFLGTGPMCRFASDLAPMLKVLSDKNASRIPFDEKVDIKALKFYYMEDDGGSALVSAVHQDVKTAMHNVLTYLKKAHGIQPQKVNITNMKRSAAIWFAKMNVKGEPDFCQELANRNGSINVYWELIKWVLCLSKHTFIALATGISEKMGVKHGSEEHTRLLEACDHMYTEFKELLGENGIFLYPTHPTVAPYHNEPVFKPLNFSYTAIINVLGFPATHIPLGLNDKGLPVGIQAVGAMNCDHHCIAVACELERAFGGWVPPAISV